LARSIDLVIGLVAPIGADIGFVVRELEAFFRSIEMETRTVRVSDWFETDRNVPNGYQRYRCLMDKGDEMRREAQRKDAVASIAVAQIAKIREEEGNGSVAVIMRQLKTPEEISSLRNIYGTRFVALSCYSSRRNRVDNLTRMLADHENEIQVNRFRAKAEHLILRDEQDSSDPWGQNVRKAFPASDLFVAVDDHDEMRRSLHRMLELLFSHPFRTPTKDECGMHQAESAALRSSALGRQVGAVIMTTGGDIVSVGTNEVPKAGGGLYWEGDSPDRRDFTLGIDTNDLFKEKLLGEIVKRLKRRRWLRKKYRETDLKVLLKKLMYDEDAVLAGAQIDNIIEFGRCVHAEMAAIVDAARRGVTVDHCELFTTTFPCHECARHIVAAGIRRVVYRVPYPKSLVRELYPDSIDVDGESRDNGRVSFEPFVGVAPRRFRQFFEMRVRKDQRGQTIRWEGDEIRLNLGDYIPSDDMIQKDEAEFILEWTGADSEKSTEKTSKGEPE
jgi:deoxycytidylate deaminase